MRVYTNTDTRFSSTSPLTPLVSSKSLFRIDVCFWKLLQGMEWDLGLRKVRNVFITLDIHPFTKYWKSSVKSVKDKSRQGNTWSTKLKKKGKTEYLSVSKVVKVIHYFKIVIRLLIVMNLIVTSYLNLVSLTS